MNSIDFQAIFQQNKIIFIIMGLVILGSIVFNIIRMRNMKSSNQRFLLDHPDVAKVYLTTKALITSEAVIVTAVDGETPEYFAETGKTGFYAIPGSRLVEMTYTYNRPGLIHKNVTTTFGPAKKELAIAANKTYLLGFDRKEETFTFDEM
jgi:Trk-type K+ transport system membrane component